MKIFEVVVCVRAKLYYNEQKIKTEQEQIEGDNLPLRVQSVSTLQFAALSRLISHFCFQYVARPFHCPVDER